MAVGKESHFNILHRYYQDRKVVASKNHKHIVIVRFSGQFPANIIK